MTQKIPLHVNGIDHTVQADPQTALIYILRNDLRLKGTKFGCGLEQCGACKVLVDGQAVPSCKLPVESVQKSEASSESIRADNPPAAGLPRDRQP